MDSHRTGLNRRNNPQVHECLCYRCLLGLRVDLRGAVHLAYDDEHHLSTRHGVIDKTLNLANLRQRNLNGEICQLLRRSTRGVAELVDRATAVAYFLASIQVNYR